MSVLAWSSPGWPQAPIAWLDERLAEAGIARTGAVEQTHVRPWSAVLRAPTTAGVVWLKAAAPATAFEAALYPLLARVAPAHVLVPLAVDVARAWVLLPDGGAAVAALEPGMLRRYGELQRALMPEAGGLLALGVHDMRPAAMPERFEEALAAAGPPDDPVVRRAAALRDEVRAWCAELAASPVPAGLDHNDVHPGNVLAGADGRVRFYDWGDAVLAHPFASLVVPLRFFAEGPERDAARDAYLEAFADLGPHEELVAAARLACRVAMIARVLTWERALRAAREAGQALDERWADAPRQTLLALLESLP